MIRTTAAVIISILLTASAWADRILIYMDYSQTDHLKAYGVAYHAVESGMTVDWLLNYRGGSFLLDENRSIVEYAPDPWRRVRTC